MADTAGRLGRYSLGIGDRFAQEAVAQLRAFEEAKRQGAHVVPVWNKSNREHLVTGSQPASVRRAADAAIAALAWTDPYFVDADHITIETVDRFVDACDFFTLDVSAHIGQPAPTEKVEAFLHRHRELLRPIELAGLGAPLRITRDEAGRVASRYLEPTAEAGRIYRHVAGRRGSRAFLTEVSMDETERPQTPAEVLIILAALADEDVPLATVAPRFSGRFNKGIDYAGDGERFEREFDTHVAILEFAVATYGLPEDLKLSVHSGSDKFMIFPAIRRTLRARGAGVHVKTSGTTWLEELVGLAEGGEDGLALAQEIYCQAFARREELCAPYAEVIDIRTALLPSPAEVRAWTANEFVGAVRHDQSNPACSPDVRQLLHVGYKIAAEMGERYIRMLHECRAAIERNVTENLYERHLRPLFIDE